MAVKLGGVLQVFERYKNESRAFQWDPTHISIFTMGFFSQDDRDQVYNGGEEHKSKFSHELIGGAAAFEASRLYEQHQAKNVRC